MYCTDASNAALLNELTGPFGHFMITVPGRIER